MMTFTGDIIASCRCGKPATHRITGHPGNRPWGYACSRCVKRIIRELAKAWNGKEESQ